MASQPPQAPGSFLIVARACVDDDGSAHCLAVAAGGSNNWLVESEGKASLDTVEESKGTGPRDKADVLSHEIGEDGVAPNSAEGPTCPTPHKGTVALRVPDYDWVQVQETYGSVQVFRHAPRSFSTSGGRGQTLVSASQGVGGGSGGSLRRFRDGLQGVDDQHDAMNGHFFTPFRPGRHSTLIMLGLPRDLPPEGVLALMGPLAHHVRVLHLLRDVRLGGRLTLLVTLDCDARAEELYAQGMHGWPSSSPSYAGGGGTSGKHVMRGGTGFFGHASRMSEQEQGDDIRAHVTSIVSVSGRVLSASGVVLVEPEGASILSCLRSVIQDGDETSYQGVVEVTGDKNTGLLAHCLVFAPHADALSFMSSLTVDEWSVATNGLDSLLAELPTCLQCLDRIDPTILQVAAPSTRHSTPLEAANCPVCHKVKVYASKGPLACVTCRIPENLWICLICSHVGCGRYTAEHAKQHFQESGHTYSLELATGRVWDYVEDMFVHAMSHVSTEDGVRVGGASGDPAAAAAAMGSIGMGKEPQGKLSGLGGEYTALLMSQLEEQRRFYEELLAKTAADLAQSSCQEDQLSDEERREVQQIQAQISKLEDDHAKLMTALRDAEEKARQFRNTNQGLLGEQKQEAERVSSVRKLAAKVQQETEVEIRDLEQQVHDLSFFLRTQEALKSSPARQELEGGSLYIQPSADETESGPRSLRGRLRRKLEK